MNTTLHGTSCFVCSEPIIINPCESCKNVELHLKMPPCKPNKPCKFNCKALVILIFILLLCKYCCCPPNCNNGCYRT